MAEWIDNNRDLVDELPENFGEEAEGQEIEIFMVEWECATASSYISKAILQEAGCEPRVNTVDAGVMWSATAAGDADFFTTAWLPNTHEAYFADFADEVDEVATNYEGARIGLVVPEYVNIDSIEQINEYAE